MSIFYPKITDEVLHNPGMGWVIHSSILRNHKDQNEPDVYDKLDYVALLSQWNFLEPKEGEFYWEELDYSIEKWINRGKKLHFRISTDPMVYNGKGEGVPDWVFNDYNVPYQFREDYGTQMKYPDYLNKVYQEKLYNFLKALSDRYGDLKELELVDLRGYGEWGEWHSGYMYDSYAERAQALREIIDIWYKAWGEKKLLVMSCSYEWRNDLRLPLHAPQSYEKYQYWSAFDYALTKTKISFRRDGVGGAVKVWDYTLMKNYFESGRKNPMVAEFFICYNQGKGREGIRGYHPEDALEEAFSLHPNYIMLMWDSVSFYNERQDLIDYGLRRMGYRLAPVKVEIQDNLKPDQWISIIHTWTNFAVGRLCEKYDLAVKVENEKGEKVKEIIDYGFEPTVLVEGKDTTFISNLQLPSKQDNYILKFAVVDKTGKAKIKLPLENQDKDGFYKVAQFSV